MKYTDRSYGETIRLSEKRGFTLLEVLLALAIVSIILAALYSSFFMAHRAVTGEEDSLVRLHEVRTLMDMIRKEVEAAVPGRETDAFIIRDRDMYGNQASELSFSTHNSPLAGPGRVEYYVEEEDERLVLVKRLTPPGKEEEGMEAEALEEVVSFTLEALQDGSWLKTWQGPGLPEELIITVTVPLRDRELTLREAVRPRVGRQL